MNKYHIIRKRVVFFQALAGLPGFIIAYLIISHYFVVPHMWLNMLIIILVMTIGLAHNDYKKMKRYHAKKNTIKMP